MKAHSWIFLIVDVFLISLISYGIGLKAQTPEGISADFVATIGLVAITLVATIVSTLSLQEMRRDREADVILYTKIDLETAFVTLFVENVGRRSAQRLRFSISGDSEIKSFKEMPFFQMTHGNFPPKEERRFVVARFRTINGEIPEHIRDPIIIEAKYQDAVLGEKTSKVEINLKQYINVMIPPKVSN